MVNTLHVFLHGQHMGVLTRGTMSAVSFRFDRDAPLDAILSLSMPTTPSGKHSGDQASPFFNGLLPDGADARLRMAQAFDSLDASTYSLLAKGGLDCAGAVQVWTEPTLPDRDGTLAPLSEREVAARLRVSLAAAGDELRDAAEHWSLSGAQRKIALRLEAGSWHLPTGTEPSSHILKPGVTTIPGVEPSEQALAEHVTMSAAAALGVDVATTSYTEFDGIAAVVVERFDRARADGALLRTHQEDACQALAVDSSRKYETDGGPGVRGLANLLRSAVADPRDAAHAVRSFARMVAFNYLAEGSDAHAKNYALLYTRDGDVTFAPMYDAATGALASRDNGTRRFPRAAMMLGTQRHFAAASPGDWLGLLRDLGLPGSTALLGEFDAMARDLPDAFATALEASGAPDALKSRLRTSPMLGRITESCTAAAASLRV